MSELVFTAPQRSLFFFTSKQKSASKPATPVLSAQPTPPASPPLAPLRPPSASASAPAAAAAAVMAAAVPASPPQRKLSASAAAASSSSSASVAAGAAAATSVASLALLLAVAPDAARTPVRVAAEGEGSEVSIGNAYCVVYRLEKSEWIVTGEGWAQVHLYRDTSDGTFRLVGWTVQDYNVVCNCNVTSTCKYKKKSADFHKFTDEDDNVYGFGFYKKEESIEESEKFMHIVCKTIEELARAAGGAPAAPAPPALPPPQPQAPPTTNAKPGSSIAAKTAALGGLKFGAAPPALATQGSFRDNTPAAPAPPASAPPSSGGVKPKPPALPAHNHAGGGGGAAPGGVASPTGRQSVSGGTIGASGKVVPAPPAPRRSVSTQPSVSGSAPTTPIGASAAPVAPAAPGAAGGSKVAPPPRKPTHSKTMSSSTVARINKPDETAKTTDSLPSNGAGAAAGAAAGGKPRPPPLGKAQSVATPGKPAPPKGPSAPGSAAAAAGAGADSKGAEMSPKQTAMQKMEDLAIEPKTHRAASVAMDMIYENKQVPLGKLKILPPKKAKKYADTATRPIITDPYGIIHTQHVKYDANTRSYQGLPPEWESQLNKQFGLPPMQVETVKLPEYKGRIPVVLEQMKKYLYANGGLQQEGIFRLAPDGDESTYVKQQLNENKFVKCNDVNCISNLIKVWFRDLPVHLLNDIKQESITSCDTEEQAGRIIATELNEVNGSIFLWLLDMCIEVSKYSNVNKMTPQNLAIVIGPNLFTPQMTDPMASLMFSQKVANFLHKSILWRKAKLVEQA